ncbi:uncharacterized protein A4U43_C03F14100, partial [Asparagus officinalis]
GKYTYSNINDLTGDGIFAVDGLKWRHQRKVASLEFSRRSLRDYSNTVFKANSAKLASIVSDAAKSNSIIDVQELFMKSTMNSICQVAFGMELNSICGNSKEFSRFLEAFDAASSLISFRFVDVSWKLKKFLNIGFEAELKRRIEEVNEFLYNIIRYKIIEASKNQNVALTKKMDVLSRLLDEKEKDPQNITTKYLRDIILSFIVAGKDTIAVTLTWFVYMLCKHPSIEAKAFKEVISVTKGLGKSESINEFISTLTDETHENMHYLHAVLTETLRLYPAVPMDPKICFNDDVLPDGYNIRKGDMVIYLPYAMGRMKFIWGDDAELFRPERWLNDAGVFSPESPFKFTAFQAGPRICLGKEFAYRQMKMIAAVLLRFFTFELRDKISPKYKIMFTLNIEKGLHVCARFR